MTNDHLLDPSWTYLNHGSFGATPAPLLALQATLRRQMEAHPVAFLHRDLWARIDTQRTAAAAFLGADPEGMGFVRNATTGVALVLHSLEPELRPGDQLLTTDHRYGAVGNALTACAARTGAEVVEAPLPFPIAGAGDVLDAIARRLTPRTRLLVVDWITSPTALVLPVQDLVALAHEHGVPVLVDGAHSPGQVDVDLLATGADFYAGNLHKWLCAPKGCAVFWAAPSWRDRLHHPIASHGYGLGLHAELDWTGTDDPTAWLCTAAAIERHEALGGRAHRHANHALLLAAEALLRQRLGARRHAPPDMLGSMATLPLPWPEDQRRAVEEALRRARFEVPVVPWSDRLWLRISAMSTYNSLAQYEALADHLAHLLHEGLEGTGHGRVS